jgi:hypothetical protein
MALSLSTLGQFALPQANINSDITPQLAALGKALKDAQDKQEASQLLSKLGQTAPAQQPASGGGLLSSLGQSLGITSQPPPQQDTQSSAPVSNATVPNDSNALPGQVGMNLALADRTQDFIQDNPGTYMSSGVRSIADQQRLYDNRASNPNPVAVPGTSKHERGLAVDIGGMTPDQRATLAQYGLGQPVANDAPHVELAPDQQPQSPVRVASNASAVPTATAAATPGANISNADLAAMMQNPYTRDIATAIWKQRMSGKQFSPQVVNGRLVAFNPQTGQATDATPAGMPSGYRPATAAEKDAFGVGQDEPIIIGPDGKPQLLDTSKTEKNGGLVNVAAGGAVFDPKTRQPVFQNSGGPGLSDSTINLMADQYIAGDKTVLQNIGRGTQGAADLRSLRNRIAERASARGLDGPAIAQGMIDYVGDTARERTAATQEGRMAPASYEAQGAIDLGRAASQAVPRTNWVPVNRAIQAYQKNTSDPALRAFGAANTTIINTYARAINPNGVGTVADKEHAREMLSTADGPEAYNAVLNQLSKEIEIAHQSPATARDAFKRERAQRTGNQAAQPSVQEGMTATNPQTGQKIVFQGGQWQPAQ